MSTEPDPRPGATVQVAVVGAGVIGDLHCRMIGMLDGADLTCVVDVDPERAGAMAAAHGTRAATDLGEALSDPAHPVDLVAICTPSGLHADLAIQAMEAGAHVLIEKPIDVDDERARRIDETRERTGVQCAVISQHRFDDSAQIVMAELEAGRLGRLTSGVASVAWWRGQSYYDSGAWRGTRALDGGGALMNQSIHTIDLLIAALGRPVEVFGYTALLAHEGIDVEDVAVGCVRFESGALGVIHGTTAAYPGLATRLQIHGDAGSAIIDDDRLTFLHRTTGERREIAYGQPGALNQVGALDAPDDAPAAETPEDAEAPAEGTVDISPSHLRQYEDLLTAIRTGGQVRVGTREARTALAVINALYESARRGAPVPIPRF